MYKYTIPENTKVLTERGFIYAFELMVGDKILNKYERPFIIENVSTCEHDTFELMFQGDNSVTVTANTLFNMSKAGNGMKNARITCTKDIIKYFDLQPIKKRPRWPLIDLKPIPKVDGNFSQLPLEPYTLGFLLGDGCFRTKSATTPFTTIDNFIVDKIKGKGFTVTPWKDSKGMITYNIKYIHEHIVDLGLKGCCSKTKFFPDLDYTIYDIVNLLQGMMDADGCVNTDSSIEITLKSENMIDWIKHYVERLGGTATKRYKRGECKEYNFVGDYWRLYIRHPDASLLFSLPRKVERTKVKPLRNRLLSYESSGCKHCFEITSASKSIILDNYIPIVGEFNE